MNLPNAVQIATQRVAAMPTDTFEQRLSKAAALQVELRKAKEELSRGEWVADEPQDDTLRKVAGRS